MTISTSWSTAVSRFHTVAGKGGASGFLEQVEDRGHAVGRDHAMTLSSFDGCPQRNRDIGAGWTVEDHVEEDVEIEQETLHRYFRLRCRREAPSPFPVLSPPSSRIAARRGLYDEYLRELEREGLT